MLGAFSVLFKTSAHLRLENLALRHGGRAPVQDDVTKNRDEAALRVAIDTGTAMAGLMARAEMSQRRGD